MTTLAKKLHLLDYFSLGFGVMVGTGWLVAMDDWLTRGGSVGAILGFLAGTIALFPVAYVYGKLVIAMPDAAGEAAYTARVFPEFVSFATGWTMMLSYFVVCPFEAVAAGKIAAYLFPALNSFELYRVGGQPVYLPHLVLGLLVVGSMTAINYRGIRLSANFQNWATMGVIGLAIAFVSAGFVHGSPANFEPIFNGNAFVSILLVVQVVPFFMEGFESVAKSAEEASADLGAHHYFIAIALALVIGGLFYIVIIAAVAYDAPREALAHERFATATAFEKALGSHWITSVVMAAGFLSLLKCFNASLVAASRLFFGLGRRGLVYNAVAYVHPVNQTPTTAIAWLGVGTALILFGGESMLVPIAEVGSVTAAVGWMAACASYACMKPSVGGRVAAYLGLVVTGLLVLMKLIPGIPGHFSVYEWIAVAIWCSIGLLLRPAFWHRIAKLTGTRAD
jgi:APA family basic amino acid/polyamine antiporter